MSKQKAEVIGPDHIITQKASQLASEIPKISKDFGISEWDVIQILTNAISFHLCAQTDMPEEEAMDRFKSCHEIMVNTYRLRDVQGEG